MYVRPTSTRLLRGMLMPAIRAMLSRSPLPLLVTRVLADHEDRAVAADDLALLAHGLDRRPYLHCPLRLDSRAAALAAVPAAATAPRKLLAARNTPERARPSMVAISGRRPLGVLVPGGEDPGPLGGHGDGELEVGG